LAPWPTSVEAAIRGNEKRSFAMTASSPQVEVEQLTWSLVDEMISPDEINRLEQLIIESDEARSTYVRCMQMHADLHYMFNEPKPISIADLEKKAESLPAPIDMPHHPTGGDTPAHG
jgi:hypothetical protein